MLGPLCRRSAMLGLVGHLIHPVIEHGLGREGEGEEGRHDDQGRSGLDIGTLHEHGR